MSLGHSIALVTAGAVAGISFVLACNGDSPPAADAAACDCPAAEAPLSRSRYQIEDRLQTIPANMQGNQGVACPDNTLFLSGSCTTVLTSALNVTLEQAGFFADGGGQGWNCFFKNNELVPVEIKASAICLKPAP